MTQASFLSSVNNSLHQDLKAILSREPRAKLVQTFTELKTKQVPQYGNNYLLSITD
jgi:hypothetical protein